MGKKRKSIATSLDEVDRTMYASFCSAANSLSQLYTHSMHHHKLSFLAGERHSLEKLYQWICRQQEEGSRASTVDILNYLQHEMEYFGEDAMMSPRVPPQHQTTPQAAATHLPNSGFQVSLGSSTLPASAGHGVRPELFDPQPKNSVFSNALSSPVRRTLQHYHISQGGYGTSSTSLTSSGNGSRNTNELNSHPSQIRELNPPSSNDSLMDMHAESPAHDSHY